MMRFSGMILGVALLLGCQQQPASAQLSETEEDRIREIVREYILENPEIIQDAIIQLQIRAQQRELQAFYDAVEQNHAAIYEDERDPRAGPDNAPITIVEFMDYKCTYCRVAAEWVRDTRERHGNQVQFIFKELPILSQESVVAARAALAAYRQNPAAYEIFHLSMVTASGPLPMARIEQLAALAGLNIEQMRTDMEDPAIAEQLRDISLLGDALGITGTPFFLVNGTVVRGANMVELEEALQRALAELG